MEEKETGNQEVPIEESLKELDGIVEKLELIPLRKSLIC